MQPMRLMALSMLAAMLVALPAAQGEEAAGDSNTPAQLLPPDAELEAAGARIGSITIASRQIFDVDDPRENYGIYRLANRLHMRTRESAVRAQLLFREGQPYRRQALEETERNLRRLQYLREPKVRPVRYHDGLVDVEVLTHDVWTLQFGPSYGRSGGTDQSSFEIQDNNLFGLGKTLAIGVGKDVDRTSTFFEWRDANLLGSRWRDGIHWTDSSDGYAHSVALWRPFYALTTRWAGGLSVAQSHWSNSRYLLGDKYDEYDSRARSTDLYVGWSPGLKGAFTRRLSLGLRQDESRFAPDATGATLGPLPADRVLRYPYLRFDLITDAFRKTTNHDQIARTEDQQFGLNATLIGGWADRGFGADRDALIVDSTVSYGFALGEDHDLFASLAASGRLEGGTPEDARLRAEAGWYWTTSPHTLLHVRAVFDTGHRLDLDHYFELGGENGLRGYPLRYQQGTRRTIAKIEERIYTEWSLWRLFDIGGAVFFDIGRTAGANPIGAPQLGWLKDAGVGLRLGNSHSSLGNVIHIDLATPIGAARDISRLQLLVGTEATF
jgi:outer membrane protein assembly factor BamA